MNRAVAVVVVYFIFFLLTQNRSEGRQRKSDMKKRNKILWSGACSGGCRETPSSKLESYTRDIILVRPSECSVEIQPRSKQVRNIQKCSEHNAYYRLLFFSKIKSIYIFNNSSTHKVPRYSRDQHSCFVFQLGGFALYILCTFYCN